jgi:hypothetical protein
MSSLDDPEKTNSDEDALLQSQTNQYLQKQNFQSSLSPSPPPSSPSLQFKQQKYDNKKEAEQKSDNKRSLENTKENMGNYIDNATIQYPSLNTEKSIDYYRQRTESLRDLSLDYLKLQKDYINAFQPTWVEHMKNNVDNYLAFQNKMIMLYNQTCNSYLKNIYDIKTNKEQKNGRQ